MAVSALKNLSNEHIWVLKTTMDKAELRQKVLKDIPWALRIVIKSFDNVASIKKIKAELVPDILTANDWTNWSTEARKILKTDQYFGNLPEKIDEFEVRETPISFEEKTFNKFRAEKNFFQRLKTIQDFLKHVEPDSDYFGEMFAYFVGFCKNFSTVNELVLSSYLLIHNIIAQYSYLNPGLDFTFEDLFSRIDDVNVFFNKIEDNELKKSFLLQIKRHIKEWPAIYTRLFTLYQSKFIIDELAANNEFKTITELVKYSINNYKEMRESFVWLVTNTIDEPWFKSLEIKFEKILISMIHILDITYREITNRRDVNTNRKLNKQIFDFLIKEERIINFLSQADEDSIVRVYTLVDDIKELDPAIKINIKHRIKELHPDFKFIGDGEKEVVRRKVIVMRKSYSEKQNELKHLLEVEVPNNSKEIGAAMQKGDLRENAEYKAALEKQELLNATCIKLQDEIRNAQIFDENSIDTESVSFGTRVKLTNLKSNNIEEYTILGPWESNPNQNIISYLSPLGAEIYNHRVEEELTFVINEHEFQYKVESIERAI
jgi:transcription elongation factor GreA